MLTILYILAKLCVIILLFYNFYYKRRKLPPGPTPMPLVGNLFSVQNTMPEVCFLRWRRQYGNVFTFWLGETPVVCVVDYATMMATIHKDGEEYAARYAYRDPETIIIGGAYGVIMTDGDLWREQRRFALHVLRNFGLGKNLMQERIIQELEAMFERIDKQIENGIELSIADVLDIGVGSIINNLLFGYRFDNDKIAEFRELKRLLREIVRNGMHPLTIIFHWNPNLFRRLPYFSGVFDQITAVNRNFVAFFERQIWEHMKVIDLQDLEVPGEDLVEEFLKEKARRDANGNGRHNYTMDQLKGLCIDLWSAGQETTSTTMAWGIAYLIHNPKAQAKLHEELDRVIGSPDRIITVSDKNDLPYTNAVICETHRVSNLVSFNLMRRLTREVTIDGHRLERGTAVCPQISAVLADENIFDNPAEFRPERFIENGKFKRIDELIHYSVGKRQCLGESLARMEMFLFTANLFNKYSFTSGQKMPSLERKMGPTIQCPPFTCRVQKRMLA